jgi:chromosome segregation ATPase
VSLDELLKICLSIIGFLILYILNDLTKSVKDATNKINSLNEKIGIIITKGDVNAKDIEEISRKVERLRDRVHEIGNVVNSLHLKYQLNWVNPEKKIEE